MCFVTPLQTQFELPITAGTVQIVAFSWCCLFDTQPAYKPLRLSAAAKDGPISTDAPRLLGAAGLLPQRFWTQPMAPGFVFPF